jgi:precorrin-4/cobalt-precorrin-4 C11-methyltransferase
VKGQRLIRTCPVILYAGSLVPEAVLSGHCAESVVNTADLHLDEIVALLEAAHAKGQDVARVHSGDPSLYGAIGEQIRRLNTLGIPYQIVPGVTAAAASAASLGCEFTLPGISQTVILTRFATKTSMPKGEQLADLDRTDRRGPDSALRRSVSRGRDLPGKLARRRKSAGHARRYSGKSA